MLRRSIRPRARAVRAGAGALVLAAAAALTLAQAAAVPVAGAARQTAPGAPRMTLEADDGTSSPTLTFANAAAQATLGHAYSLGHRA